MTNPLPKFRTNEVVKTVPEWPVEVIGLVLRQGERYSKNKKGDPVFECHSYIVRDASGKLHYFLEGELH